MPIPEKLQGIPEFPMWGTDGARMLWDCRNGTDIMYGTVHRKNQRYWFTYSSYDEEKDDVLYSVYAITPEEARILDDWYAIFSLLTKQYVVLANDPATADSQAVKAKGAQLGAFTAALPRFESTAAVGYFAVSEYSTTPAGKPMKIKPA
jgi:hypothetical protein